MSRSSSLATRVAPDNVALCLRKSITRIVRIRTRLPSHLPLPPAPRPGPDQGLPARTSPPRAQGLTACALSQHGYGQPPFSLPPHPESLQSGPDGSNGPPTPRRPPPMRPRYSLARRSRWRRAVADHQTTRSTDLASQASIPRRVRRGNELRPHPPYCPPLLLPTSEGSQVRGEGGGSPGVATPRGDEGAE